MVSKRARPTESGRNPKLLASDTDDIYEGISWHRPVATWFSGKPDKT